MRYWILSTTIWLAAACNPGRGGGVALATGCDLSTLPAPKGVVQNWTVPDFSADFNSAEQSIRDQVTKLVDELLKKP